MALDIWATIDGLVHLAAGRLSASRAATESLPPPARTGVTPLDMMRTVILAEVAARTDDRTLLQQMVNDARDAYSTGSSVVGRGAAHVLALAAWQRDDVQDAMRWLRRHHAVRSTILAPGLRSGDLGCAGGVSRRRCRLARTCPAGH